jgi:hypothetical protein
MNVKQALKEKNKTVKKIAEQHQRLAANNSVEKGAERPYDPKVALDNWLSEINSLIDLKTRIHKANAKVYDKIFRLAELKSVVKQLKHLDCSSGKQNSIYGRRSGEDAIVKEAAITLIDRDQLIKKFEDEIELLQEELDAHNAKVKV